MLTGVKKGRSEMGFTAGLKKVWAWRGWLNRAGASFAGVVLGPLGEAERPNARPGRIGSRKSVGGIPPQERSKR